MTLSLFPELAPAPRERKVPEVTFRDALLVGPYRYSLARGWGDPNDYVLFVMLNPSYAGATNDDDTVCLCMRDAAWWGFGGLRVANLFAYVSTDPRGLLAARDPIGPACERYIDELARGARRIVVAWGQPPSVPRGSPERHPFRGRAEAVLSLLTSFGDVYCLTITKGGWPHHPLRLEKALTAAGPTLYRRGRGQLATGEPFEPTLEGPVFCRWCDAKWKRGAPAGEVAEHIRKHDARAA